MDKQSAKNFDPKSIEKIQIIKDDEIDLVALTKTIWNGRRIIIYSVTACMIIGLIIAFSSPKKFTASATLLPSVEKKGGNLGNLSALAGMAGLNLGGIIGDPSGIPPELYPQVVGSVPFLKELMHEKLTWEKFPEQLSIYEMIERDTLVTFGAKFKKYTIGLPFTLKNAIFSEKKKKTDELVGTRNNGIVTNYIVLSKFDRAALDLLKKAIKLQQDKKSGLVTIYVTMQEPLLSAQLTSIAVELLQRNVIDYKIKQSVGNLRFLQERYAEAKVNYEMAQRAFFDYKDIHRNIVEERMDIEFQRRSDTYDIASAIYKGLSQQQEQAKITVKEETPVFMVLDPVVVPNDKSAPKRGLIMAVSMFMGVFLGILSIIGILVFNNLRSKQRTEI